MVKFEVVQVIYPHRPLDKSAIGANGAVSWGYGQVVSGIQKEQLLLLLSAWGQGTRGCRGGGRELWGPGIAGAPGVLGMLGVLWAGTRGTKSTRFVVFEESYVNLVICLTNFAIHIFLEASPSTGGLCIPFSTLIWMHGLSLLHHCLFQQSLQYPGIHNCGAASPHPNSNQEQR